MTRRHFLRTAAGAAALAGCSPGFESLRAAASKIGVPLRITKVEPIPLRAPAAPGRPESDFVSMTPLGETTGGKGLWDRLERSETVRQGGYQQTLLVKISTDQGITGWGEAHAVMTPMVVKTVLTDLFEPILLGQDARQIEALWEKMFSTQKLRGYGTGFFTRAMAGVDIALWDIVGKAAEMPVYQLLGGKFRDRIPTYEGVGGGSPEDVGKNVRELLATGYTVQKMSLAKGRGEEIRNVDRVAAAADALRDKGEILVDSLGGYTLSEATRVGRRLDAMGNVGWWEDILTPDDLDGYARLADTLDMPICMGEQYSNRFQFRDIFQVRACDIINPDTARIGITETKRIAVMAEAHGVLFSPHSSMGAAPYRASAIHLCAAQANTVILEGGESYKRALGNALLSTPLPYEPGSVGVPAGPGLGFDFDEEALAKVTIR